MTTDARPTAFGELKASGYRPVTVKEELRRNLIQRIRSGLAPGGRASLDTQNLFWVLRRQAGNAASAMYA